MDVDCVVVRSSGFSLQTCGVLKCADPWPIDSTNTNAATVQSFNQSYRLPIYAMRKPLSLESVSSTRAWVRDKQILPAFIRTVSLKHCNLQIESSNSLMMFPSLSLSKFHLYRTSL